MWQIALDGKTLILCPLGVFWPQILSPKSLKCLYWIQGWFGEYLNWFSIFGRAPPTPSDAIPLPQAQKAISLNINVIYWYGLHVVLAYICSVSFLSGIKGQRAAFLESFGVENLLISFSKRRWSHCPLSKHKEYYLPTFQKSLPPFFKTKSVCPCSETWHTYNLLLPLGEERFIGYLGGVLEGRNRYYFDFEKGGRHFFRLLKKGDIYFSLAFEKEGRNFLGVEATDNSDFH